MPARGASDRETPGLAIAVDARGVVFEPALAHHEHAAVAAARGKIPNLRNARAFGVGGADGAPGESVRVTGAVAAE